MYIVFIRLFIRLLLGVILLSTGITKLVHLKQTQRGIQDYQLIPASLEAKLVPALAFLLPLVELVTGGGLISGLEITFSTFLSLCLLLIFTIAIIINLRRGRSDLSCHCAGILGNHTLSWWSVLRNSSFIISLLFLLVTPSDVFTVENILHNPSNLNIMFWENIFPVTLLVVTLLMIYKLASYAKMIWQR